MKFDKKDCQISFSINFPLCYVALFFYEFYILSTYVGEKS